MANVYENPTATHVHITHINDTEANLQANLKTCQSAIITDATPPRIGFKDHLGTWHNGLHAALHEAGGVDELFDQNLNTTNYPEFPGMHEAGRRTFYNSYSCAPGVWVPITLFPSITTLVNNWVYRIKLLVLGTSIDQTAAVYIIEQTSSYTWEAIRVAGNGITGINPLLRLDSFNIVQIQQNHATNTYSILTVVEGFHTLNNVCNRHYFGLEGSITAENGVVNIPDLTASQLVATDANKNLVSVNRGLPKVTYTFDYVDLFDTDNAVSIVAWALPAGAIVEKARLKVSTAFAGTGITEYYLSLGVSGAIQDIMPEYRVDNITPGGAEFALAWCCQSYNYDSSTNVYLSARSVGGYLNAATAGEVTVEIYYQPKE